VEKKLVCRLPAGDGRTDGETSLTPQLAYCARRDCCRHAVKSARTHKRVQGQSITKRKEGLYILA